MPPRVITGPRMQQPLSRQSDYSVFDVLNIFRAQWFLSQDSIIKNIISAQKDPDGTYTWVKLTPQYYSYLIRLALRLIPLLSDIGPCWMPSRWATLVKKVLFMYILEIFVRGTPQRVL
jgi:hypothetical protein